MYRCASSPTIAAISYQRTAPQTELERDPFDALMGVTYLFDMLFQHLFGICLMLGSRFCFARSIQSRLSPVVKTIVFFAESEKCFLLLFD